MNILRRRPGWPADRSSEVAPEWVGLTAVLIGGGASLTIVQVDQVRAARAAGTVRVISVNDAYRVAPFADLCYFADSKWWARHKDHPAFQAFTGQKCSISDSEKKITDTGVHILRNEGRAGISFKPDAICTGRNGGYQAMNVAILAGAKRIILLGFDAREPGVGDKSHWFGEHPDPEPVSVYADYRKAFSAAERILEGAGVRVINCSPGSAINSFTKMDLSDALADLYRG